MFETNFKILAISNYGNAFNLEIAGEVECGYEEINYLYDPPMVYSELEPIESEYEEQTRILADRFILDKENITYCEEILQENNPEFKYELGERLVKLCVI